MKITLLHYAAPPVVGGVETVLARQAQQLARAGHVVRILAGRGEAWNASIPVEILPRLDSRHPHVLKAKASLDRGQTPAGFQALVEQIQNELARALEGVDVLIAHNVASLHKNLALTAALYNLSQSPGFARLILWHHDLAWGAARYDGELHPGWPWDLLRTPWPGAKQVTISEPRRQELAALFNLPPEEITVIPAGLDLLQFLKLGPRAAALLESLDLVMAAPVLLTPVRLTRRKNIELALQTLATLKVAMPQAALVVTGPPGAHNPANLEYLKQLQALRAELGLQDSAHLLAEYVPDGLPEESVADFFRLSDALLLPSREEGFGIPILEAGLTGLPVFCSDLPSLRALAGRWATFFSPDERPQALAGLIFRRLQDDPVYQLRISTRQKYSWDAIYQRQIAPLLETP